MSDAPVPKEALEALRSLIRADLTAATLRHAVDKMPERQRLEENRSLAERAREMLAKADALLAAADRELKRFEDESAAITAKIDKERARLYSGTVTSSKELSAIEKEIESLTRRLTSQDDEVITAMEKVEGIKAQRDDIAGKSEVAERNIELLSSKVAAAEAEAEEKLTPLTGDRTDYLKDVGEAVAARYKAAESRRNGVGGAFLHMGSCGACHTELPGSDRQKIAHGDIVGECPHCHSLLVSEV